ncbi:TCP-1_chaperonin subunit theta [Hexamita inflata]|uniref:CCT-theta n=1 Tax=Hexamita inflata TaxID=28002 RepID=A0AA86P119_9EUKA|nr:TCP-1 chaperonin subunit theta [Hexamita inflata]
MSLPVQGLQGMMKGGTKNLQGMEEAVFMNIKATKELAAIARTSMGPHGLFKMIVNHLEKLIVTKNAVQMTSELEVKHPAAKMVVMAAANQALEFGDGTNLVITLAGELLAQAEQLLQQGIVVQDVVSGYEKAFKYIQDNIEKIRTPQISPLTEQGLKKLILSAVSSKQYGQEVIISNLISQAVLQIVKDGDFNADFVRVAKIPGGGIEDSFVVRGLVVPVQPRGIVQKMENCKIVVFSCPVELRETETKGTILLDNADELQKLSKNEEKTYEELILSYKNQGINVLVSQMNIHELALHYCNKYGIMVIKISSKYETRRFAISVGAELLTICRKAEAEVPVGFCSKIFVDEVGDKKVIVCRDDRTEDSRNIATVVLRAATENVLNDIALAVGNGVNVAKVAITQNHFLPGAGATELELAQQLKKVAAVEPGLEQYSIRAFADALEIVPRILAETAGLNADQVITELCGKHAQGLVNVGVNVEGIEEQTIDTIEASTVVGPRNAFLNQEEE